MNKEICKKIIENKDKFTPFIFTIKQINIIKKYINNTKLTNSEKSYLYSTIKKKLDALSILKEEFYITGKNMIKERIIEAKTILKDINKEAFISGTFLFSKEYNDIDIYIISKRRKQYHKGKKHFIFITEDDLKKPIFTSAANYSMSNFFINKIKPIIKRPNFDDIIMTYELAINEILDNDDQKMIKNIIFDYYLYTKNELLDSYSINKKFNEIKQLNSEKKLEYINNITKELLLSLYSNKYVYQELSPFITRLRKDAETYKANDNLFIYIDLFSEVKNECRRAQT